MDDACRQADQLDARLRAGETALAGELLALLDRLMVVEHGLRWRYIPGGRFAMGSTAGDPDEAPVHPVELAGFWVTEAPISWADHCRLLDWEPPPRGLPQGDPPSRFAWFGLFNGNKIRLQYCEDRTARARDWHAHVPDSSFGPPKREEGPWSWSTKPMVAASWHDAREVALQIRTPDWLIDLPTEAQWERAARGFHHQQPYPWGDAPPTADRCDFDAFKHFRIRPSRDLPPNDYGLYGMSGGVWEWCRDHYDASFYQRSPSTEPLFIHPDRQGHRVLRGGSWADCDWAQRVSFRMSLRSSHWAQRKGRGVHTPTVGYRLVRYRAPPQADA